MLRLHKYKEKQKITRFIKKSWGSYLNKYQERTIFHRVGDNNDAIYQRLERVGNY